MSKQASQALSLVEPLLAGERRALARAITLVESTRAEDAAAAAALLERLAPHAGGAIRIGISGAPGVGKSTFIEALGKHLVARGLRVAVLSIDPSSALTGGSILGDKTRMADLAREDNAFIRPSPSGATRGGVARHTRESILLCEAAGFDVVAVETVGVGQAETAVADMTDLFVLLLPPTGGDELQGIKRGIVELADMVLVNKADGELEASAGRTAAEYANALRLVRARSAHWEVPVHTCSALTGAGIEAFWSRVEDYRRRLGESGELERRRAAQAKAWLWSEINDMLAERLGRDPRLRERLARAEQAVAAGSKTAANAAREVVGELLGAAAGDGSEARGQSRAERRDTGKRSRKKTRGKIR